MQVRLLVEAEREDGMYVSKDLIADEVLDILTGEEVEYGEGKSAEVTDSSYEGSSKGKPIRIMVDMENAVCESEDEIQEIGEALMALVDGQSLQPEDSEYTVTYVDWEVIPS